jgi:hypothetical protein
VESLLDGSTRYNQRISGLLWPFLGNPKKGSSMHARTDLIWEGNELRLFSSRGRVQASIQPDETWSGLWRVRLPHGYLTDVVNLSRATDAAASLALAALNRRSEAA